MARGDRPVRERLRIVIRCNLRRRLALPLQLAHQHPREDQNAAEQGQQRQTLTGQPAKNTGPYRFTGINKGGPRRRETLRCAQFMVT